jgi:predicted porin
MYRNKNGIYKCVSVLLLTCSMIALPAISDSSITVSGTIDTYFGSMRMAGDTVRNTALNSGGMTTSWFGFKGSEDLGGGLKAKFTLTSFYQADSGRQGRFPSGDTFFSRDANVGLSGPFGTISLGRDLAPNFLPTILFNPFGDSFTISPLILHADVPIFNNPGWNYSLAGETGWSNEIVYTTPQIRGFTANVHYQFGEIAGNNGRRNIGTNFLYFTGPLAFTGFYHKVRVNNPLPSPINNVQPGGNIPLPSGATAAEQTAWMLGSSYDLNVAKFYLTYGQTKHDIDFEDKTGQIGGAVPIGNGTLLASWAQTQRRGVAVGPNMTRNTATIGYDYNLSKRTDVYAFYMNDRITNRDSGDSIGAGIRHRF